MRTSSLRVVSSGPVPAAVRDQHGHRARERPHLGQILVENGALSAENLLKAMAIRARQDGRLSDILLVHGMVSQAELQDALEQQWGCATVNLRQDPPDARLVQMIGSELCLRLGFIPWKQLAGGMVCVVSRPEQFDKIQAALPAELGTAYLTLGEKNGIDAALLALDQSALAHMAETRVALSESCRGLGGMALKCWIAALAAIFLIAMVAYPRAVFVAIFLWTLIALLLFTALKIAAAIARFHHSEEFALANALTKGAVTPAKLPMVSILVPLFKENEIAAHLVRRLKRLNYPKELLDVCLVVEADDHTTIQTIANTKLPNWVRVIPVPDGRLRTKPRALNFALDFCKGSIIGVYDAEDAPDPDQIHRVVRRFHERGPEVACLQGVLDFYNARTNWLSRCFTVEYATWFRIILPGLVKLGFLIPLGGTTVFFRRDALEKLGGWDAHNVTEDADLGIRLARYGYRTELVETVTEEEANCRMLPWIKQRSRWLKGYAATWAVHMRAPGVLLGQLGWWRFLGFQLMFLGTLTQFVLAPVLWSFWLILFDLPHPLVGLVPRGWLLALGAVFLFTELVTIGVGILAVSGQKHRYLRWWVPTLHFYFPLGALASYKGLYELATRPFYWDKTSHGIFAPTRKNPTLDG
ncbi:MAG: glycosyltransferase family 2 protein [Halocynthiibacter sp.]